MPSTPTLPEWDRVLSAAAHLQRILPDAVLVGGTAAAIYAGHRLSTDADHVLTDLRMRFDVVLAELESVSGLTTARVARPVLVLGSLDGIETGVRQLIRTTPLETQRLEVVGGHVTVPTAAEILRIKGVLILRRNTTRDYLDFVALSDHLGTAAFVESLRPFDGMYPQPNGESALHQLQIQLASPLPYDLDDNNLAEYKNLAVRWHDWNAVKSVAAFCATTIFDHITGVDETSPLPHS